MLQQSSKLKSTDSNQNSSSLLSLLPCPDSLTVLGRWTKRRTRVSRHVGKPPPVWGPYVKHPSAPALYYYKYSRNLVQIFGGRVGQVVVVKRSLNAYVNGENFRDREKSGRKNQVVAKKRRSLGEV